MAPTKKYAPSGAKVRQEFVAFMDFSERGASRRARCHDGASRSRHDANDSRVVWRYKLPEQPGTREGPVALRGAADNAQGRSGIVERESRIEAQLDQLGPSGVDQCEPAEGLVEVDEIVGRGVLGDEGVKVATPAVAVAAPLEPLAIARAVVFAASLSGSDGSMWPPGG
jgi:hypothetical protein